MHIPTPEQALIIEAARTTSDNLIINALAGAAKTTTLEMICHAITGIPILSLAFNKRIADEMAKRLPSHVEVRTLNALGHRVWAQAINKRLVVKSDKMHALVKGIIDELPRSVREEAYEDIAETLKWLRFAKRDGYIPSKWAGLGNALVEQADWFDQYDEEPTRLQRDIIEQALGASIRNAYAGEIDFDDQLYMPCQPAGTQVLTKYGNKSIEEIVKGDEVISFDRKLSKFVGFYNHGSTVDNIARRIYDGNLFKVSFADESSTEATQEHKWLVRFIPELERKDLWTTYLMYKDGSFKLGQCQIRSVRPGGSDGLGLACRCTFEGAEKAWILEVHDTQQKAKLFEAINVIKFGITDCAFRSDIGEWIHRFQRRLEDIKERAINCLVAYDRDIRFPFWESHKTRAFNRNFITQSCNLIETLMEIPLCEGTAEPNWQKFHIEKRQVSNFEVFSLSITRHELYVANGILTHNCCFGGTWPKFPLVMCDEVQDLSPINHVMLEKLVYQRIIVVGDPWQSIYGFRGSVSNGMEALRVKFNMRELTLSTTFRVPKLGVERAWFRVPHMRAPDSQIDGHIEVLREWESSAITDHSAIICRNNAPLFSCALRLIKANRAIKLVGMDIGPGLVRVMKKLGPTNLARRGIEDALELWLKREIARAKRVETVYERYECLRVLACREDCRDLGQAIAFAEALFKQDGPIQLLSGHKAKGLEWKTVYHLDPWRIPSKFAKEGTEEYEQELNVRYVIETRFKENLYLINLEDMI